MKNIESILADLYNIDPNLKQHEAELRLLIQELIVSKPHIVFDEHFAENLRERLVLTDIPVKSPYMPYVWTGIGSALLGALIIVLVILPTLKSPSSSQLSPSQVKSLTTNAPFKKQTVKDIGKSAFGTLAYVPSGKGSASSVQNNTSAPTSPNQTSTSAPVATHSTFMAPSISGTSTNGNGQQSTSGPSVGSTAPGAPMIAPMPSMPLYYNPTIIKYTYSGDPIVLSNTDGKVYKRIKHIDLSNDLNGVLQNFTLSLTSLSSFSNLGIKNLELAENKPNGYQIGINADEGTINIYENMQAGNSSTPTQINPSQIPDNTTLIGIANQFLKDHGISTALYKAPLVQSTNTFPILYNKAGISSSMAVKPGYNNTISVLYPLTIDGTDVYDEMGNPFGLEVYIDLNQQKVASVGNLNTQTYDSSSYDLETDSQKVVNLAINGFNGENGSILPSSTNIKTIDETLGTPRNVLMRYWSYDNGVNSELYVPALLFPISNQLNNNLYRTNIIIPLVKEILNKKTTIVPPIPMKMSSSRTSTN